MLADLGSTRQIVAVDLASYRSSCPRWVNRWDDQPVQRLSLKIGLGPAYQVYDIRRMRTDNDNPAWNIALTPSGEVSRLEINSNNMAIRDKEKTVPRVHPI